MSDLGALGMAFTERAKMWLPLPQPSQQDQGTFLGFGGPWLVREG